MTTPFAKKVKSGLMIMVDRSEPLRRVNLFLGMTQPDNSIYKKAISVEICGYEIISLVTAGTLSVSYTDMPDKV